MCNLHLFCVELINLKLLRWQNSVTFSWADRRAKMWRFSNVSATNYIPVLSVCRWFGRTRHQKTFTSWRGCLYPRKFRRIKKVDVLSKTTFIFLVCVEFGADFSWLFYVIWLADTSVPTKKCAQNLNRPHITNPLNSSILDEGVVGGVAAVLGRGRSTVLAVEEAKIIMMTATLAAGT